MIKNNIIILEFKTCSGSVYIQHFEKRGLLYSFYEIRVCMLIGEDLLLSVNAWIVYKNVHK